MKLVNAKLKNILRKSTFTIVSGTFYYIKVSSIKNLEGHFMISKDDDEITVVTRHVPKNILEKNKEKYALISLNVSVPFYSVGFLATVSSAIADSNNNVLIISTYSKDYVLVKKNVLNKVKKILMDLGMRLK